MTEKKHIEILSKVAENNGTILKVVTRLAQNEKPSAEVLADMRADLIEARRSLEQIGL